MKLEVGKKYVNARGTVITIYGGHPDGSIFHGTYDRCRKVNNADIGQRYVSYSHDGRATRDFGDDCSLVREYEVPVEYTVDVWVDRKPIPGNIHMSMNKLPDYLFGEHTNWNKVEYGHCTRHLRITVEEVVE